MNLYKKEIYKKSLQHAERRNHKYLYKIGDRYIYPEDVAGKAKSTASNIGSMASAAGTAAKTKISNVIADQKQKHKDRKFVKNSNPGWSNEGANRSRIETEKRNEESWRKHIQSPEYKQGEYNRKASEIGDEEAYKRMVASNRPGRRKSSELENQKKKTADRKKAKVLEKEKVDTQRKSAHAGYEASKKAFPEGGSTEELERQKRKTKARKSASKRFNELDQKNKKRSNNMEPDIQKQHSQINSAHQMATERRMAGNSFSDRKWNRQDLFSVNYYDQSGSIERQKRKTALRKRHKK